jgi:hypothetical protein
VCDRFGLAALAREAGVPESTVRSFRNRGWVLQSLPMYEALVSAAERLDRRKTKPAPEPGSEPEGTERAGAGR